jgi:two-component system, cell cycle response regulator DivK
VSGAPPPLVLVVEDNPANLLLVEAVLRRAGYRILSAGNAEDALDLLRTEQPLILLTDVQLPGVSGLDLARQVRGDPTLTATVIVALTAFAMPEDRSHALAAGCDGYLSKPINTRTFATDLAAIVQSAQRSARPSA